MKNVEAMDKLAKMYCHGLVVKRNNTRFVIHLRMSATYTHVRSLIETVSLSHHRCFKLAAKASRRGHMPATQQLAWMYHNGKV